MTHVLALGIIATVVGFVYLWILHPDFVMGLIGVLVVCYLYHSLTKSVREWIVDGGFFS
jgi:hypothetical protein